MYRRDRDRAFADGRRDTLRAPAAHVANREDTRQTRLEEMGWATQRPLRGPQLVRGQRRSRLDESLRIERQASGEPLRARLRPGHRENMPDVLLLHGSAPPGTPCDALHMTVSFEAHDLRALMYLDSPMRFHATDQVTGHPLRRPAGTNQHVHALRGLRQEHRRLPRRVRAAHDGDLLAGAKLRFHARRGVLDTRAFEP